MGDKKTEPIEEAILESAERLSEGLIERLKHLTEKEEKVRFQANWETLPNMPARLLWEALEPEAGAFFVVYKLMHEMRSELPKVFRAIAWKFCSVQPERFGLVTYREQLWDVLASVDYWEEEVKKQISQQSVETFVAEHLEKRTKKDWWSYREEDFERDVRWIAERLKENNNLLNGFKSLRNLQVQGQSTLTAGNVIMQIPTELQSLTENIIAQGDKGFLPPFDEIRGRIAELTQKTKDNGIGSISTNQSVPFDLLAFDAEDNLYVFCLTRTKATEIEMKDLRRRLIYLRYWTFRFDSFFD